MTIRTSLQAGEWVISIHCKGAYFHIPIQSQSMKYMRFQVHDQSHKFKALPFGLSTESMEFTVVAKDVKLLALQRGIRIHRWHQPQVDLFATRFNKLLQTPWFAGNGCTQSVLGGSGSTCLPIGCLLRESGGEVAGLPMQQDHSD